VEGRASASGIARHDPKPFAAGADHEDALREPPDGTPLVEISARLVGGHASPRIPAAAKPHDRLWKRVFSRKAAFAVELRRMLPPELLDHLDLSTLARYPTERIDERLHGRISDLCYTAEFIDGERRLPAIFPAEHYSTPTPSFPLRAVVCAGEILYEHLADHPHAKVFPLIVPLAFTQPGARGTPTQLSTILDVPPHVRECFPSPIEVRAYVDDFDG
jgi:Putative transposase, YhgA-like